MWNYTIWDAVLEAIYMDSKHHTLAEHIFLNGLCVAFDFLFVCHQIATSVEANLIFQLHIP